MVRSWCIVGRSFRRPATHTRAASVLKGGSVLKGDKINLTYHAEFKAILQVKGFPKLKECILIVVRKDGKMSKPCQHCTNFILSSGIKRVYYSDDSD